MASNTKNFNKIFREVEEKVFGPEHHHIPQKDTSEFEQLYKDDPQKLMESEFDIMKNKEIKIVLPKSNSSNQDNLKIGVHVDKRYIKEWRSKEIHDKQISNMTNIEVADWYHEVKHTIEIDTGDNLEKEKEKKRHHGTKDSHRFTHDANKIPIHIHTKVRLPDEIAPFSCFEPDYVNIDCLQDPLEEVIPNLEHEFLQPDFEVLKKGNKTNNSQEVDKVQQPTSSIPSSTTSSSQPPKNSSNDSQKDNGLLDDLFERYNKRISERNFVSDGAKHIIDREAERKQCQLQKAERIRAAGQSISFDASSLLDIDRGDRRNRDISTFHSQNRSFIASANHHHIARHHRNTKPDLSEAELKHFHRPRLRKETISKPWRITLNSYSKKKSSTTFKQSQTNITEEQDKKNLSLSNNNKNFILLEYIEEFPPIILNPGMASMLINYYRPPKHQEDIHKHTKSTSTSSRINYNDQQSIKRRKVNESELKLYENVLPSHVLSLYKLNYIDRLFEVDPLLPKQKLGKIKVIKDNDKSPFLGQLKEKEIQISFENNLFRVPLYEYCSTTDFLIIREENHVTTTTSSSSSSTNNQQDMLRIPFSIREIPNMFIAGQMEPHKIVPSPSLDLNETQKQFYLLAIMKYYRKYKHQRRTIPSCQEVMKHILRFCLDEEKTPHKFIHRMFFQPQISNIPQGLTSYIRPLIDSNISILLVRHPSHESILYDYQEPEDNSLYSYENICKQLLPEHICLQEASLSAEYRLLTYHNITNVTVQAIANYLYFWDIVKTNFKERIDKFKEFKVQLTTLLTSNQQQQLQSNESTTSSSSSSFEGLRKEQTKEQIQVQLQGVDLLITLLHHDIERIHNRLKIARFILGRIVIAPWNTTHTFVNSRGRMDICGIGDPSGRGEAFAYAVIPQNTLCTKLSPDEINKKKQPKVVGTDADLRKLTNKEQIERLVSLGYTHENASNLKRWDRTHIISENVNRFNRLNNMVSPELVKYIRNSKTQLTEKEFQDLCQFIWEKQKSSLFDNTKLTLSKEALQRERKRSMTDQQVISSDNSPNLSPEMSPEVPSQQDLDDNMNEDDEDDLTSTYLDDQIESDILCQRQERLQSLLSHGLTTSSASWMTHRNVVKRVTRTINIYGQETIKIQFIINSTEVNRVEEKEHRMISEAPDKHSLTALKELKQKYTLPFIAQGKNTKKLNEPSEYDDINEGKHSCKSTSMTINLSKGKRSNGLVSKGGNQQNHEIDSDNSVDEELEVMQKTISSKRSGANLQIIKNSRLPRVALAIKFESELMIIWNNKNAERFHYPIDRIQYPNYYFTIKSPICLSDIREKIASFQYDSAHQLLQDMELLKNNAIRFNGSHHILARQASSLYDNLKQSLYRDRELLGINHDSIHILEDILRNKPHSSHVSFQFN